MLAPTPYFADRGCHVRIYEEARTLRNLGHDVRIVTYHLGRDMGEIPTFRIPAIPWYKKLSAGPSWHKPYLDILLFFKALKVAKSFEPDILHAHLHEGALLGIFLKKILKIPLLFDFQGSLTAEIIDHGFISGKSLLFRVFHGLEKFINRSADFIITSSGRSTTDLQKNGDIDATRVRCLMDGVDCNEFRAYAGEEARRELKLPANEPVAVFLGVLNSYQGVDILLEVVRALKEKDLALHFLIMGFPEEKYRRIADEMGLSDRITFTGRIDYSRAAFYLSAGDVALSPKISLTEANGKLFNYMACGLPTVAFDTPINREILGDAGVYAKYADAGDFAAGLEALILSRERRLELGKSVRELAVRDHSWKARGRALEEIYREITEDQNPALFTSS
jgi:glycosyltransferase involved in cell wall biosynthesis